MSINAKSGSVTVGGLLGGDRFYNVPMYQRPYSWEEEQVKQLWEDIVGAFEEDGESNYFIGSVVLIEPNKHNFRYDIIDGQQRITTLSLLFIALIERFEGNQRFKDLLWKGKDILSKELERKLEIEIIDYQEDWLELLPNPSEYGSLTKINRKENKTFSEKSEKEKKKIHKDNPYLANGLLLRDFIHDFHNRHGDKKLSDLIVYIEKKIELVEIVCNDQQSALRIFQTLNTRGLDLTVSDLVKAECMKLIPDSNERKEFIDKWLDIEKNLGKIKSADIKLDKLLLIYTETHRFTGESKIKPAKLEGEEKKYQDYLLKDALKSGLTTKEFVEDFGATSDIVCDLFNNYFRFGNIDSYFFLLNEQIKTEYWYYPVVQFMRYKKRNKYTKTDFESLLGLLVKILYRATILKLPQTITRPLLRNITLGIYENKPIEKIILKLKKLVSMSELFGDRLIKKVLSKELPKNIRNSIVCLCALKNKKMDFYEYLTKLNVEHILPVKYKGGYDWTEDEHDKYLNTIGNLVLIESKINITLGNTWFEGKKNKYTTSKFSEVKRIAKEYETWTPRDCKKRNEEMVKVVLELLSLK